MIRLFKNCFLIIIFLSSIEVFASEIEYFLVGSINDGVPVKQKTYYIKNGDSLKLYLVLRSNNKFFSRIPEFRSGKITYKTKQDNYQKSNDFSWFLIHPVLKEYSNLWDNDNPDNSNIHIEPVFYKKNLLNKYSFPEVDFNLITNEGAFGTYYLSVELNNAADNGSQFKETSALNNKYSHKTVQIVYRKDNSYIGFLTELYNTPFIISPMKTDAGYHETDSRIGSDCAAFAIYGKRRQGLQIPYCGPRGILKYLTEIYSGVLLPLKSNGTYIYTNKKLEPVKTGISGIDIGDIVHFGGQVSVFYKDMGVKGILDKDDLLFQCYKDTPRITTIAESGFYSNPVRLFKWKDQKSDLMGHP